MPKRLNNPLSPGNTEPALAAVLERIRTGDRVIEEAREAFPLLSNMGELSILSSIVNERGEYLGGMLETEFLVAYTDLLLKPARLELNARCSSISDSADKISDYSRIEKIRLRGNYPDAIKEEFLSDLRDLAEAHDLGCKGSIDHLLKEEADFVALVIGRCMTWSKENDPPIVLWDVDKTLGNILEGGHWAFRPSVFAILHYLSEAFPQLKNGLLTAREYEVFPTRINSLAALAPIVRFLNEHHCYSCGHMINHVEAFHFKERSSLPQSQLADFTGDFYPRNCVEKSKLLALDSLLIDGHPVHLIEDREIHAPNIFWLERVLSSRTAPCVASNYQLAELFTVIPPR